MERAVTHNPEAPPPRHWYDGAWLTRLLMALAALVMCFSAVAIWRYGFGELFQDQFRLYRWVYEHGLPSVLIEQDNQHRLVFSNVVRWLELRFLGGDQRLGIAVGLLAMFATWGLIARESWRDRQDSRVRAAAVCLLGALVVFWAGSARLQFHGNETLQVYIVFAMALLANRLVSDDRRSSISRWLLAILAALVALSSFGFGMAVFAGMTALAIVLRRPWPEVLVAVAGAAVAVFAYLVMLPGGESVRHTLAIEPLAMLVTAASWLGSSVNVAWFGLGVEGLLGLTPQKLAEAGWISAVLVSSSASARAFLGIDNAASAALLAGTLGLFALVILCLRAWRAPGRVGAIERMGLGLALFGSGSAALVAIGRLDYFREYPGQLLSDRYVLWTAVFWFGLLVAATARVRPVVPATLAVLLLVVLMPSHRVGAGWATSLNRHTEARAAEAQSGVRTEGWLSFADMPDLHAVDAVLSFYREHRLAMFRLPRAHALGQVLDLAALVDNAASTATEWREQACTEVALVPAGNASAWHVSGVIARRLAPDEGVIALDADARVIGLGEFGFEAKGALFSRIDASGHGFDLYLAPGVDPGRTDVRLYLVDAVLTRMVPLSSRPCLEPRRQAAAQW